MQLTAQHAWAVQCGMLHQLLPIFTLHCSLSQNSTCTITPGLPASDHQDAPPVCAWQLVHAALQYSLIHSQMPERMLCSHRERESNTNARCLGGTVPLILATSNLAPQFQHTLVISG